MHVNNKIIELQIHHHIKQTQLHIEFYETKLNRIIRLKNIDLENEPFSFNKKEHKKWEKEIENYDKEIKETNLLIDEERKSLEELMQMLKDK